MTTFSKGVNILKKMVTLYADEGKVLTNGEIYATTMSLAKGSDGEEFYEITREEYEKILKEQERKEREANAE